MTVTQPTALRRHLGVRESIALGIGGVLGAGIFVLSGIASGRAGPAVIVAFVLAFAASLLLGFCYAELASQFPTAGGPYGYACAVFGAVPGALVGWAYWGAWATGSSWVALGFGNYLHLLIGISPLLGAYGLIIGLVLLNLLGVGISGKVQVVIIALEILLLVGFIVLGLPHIHAVNYQPFAPNGITGILGAALLGFLSLTGWDVIVVASEEMDNPRRTIPLAIFTSLAIILVLYTGMLFVANGILTWQQLGHSATPISDVSAQVLGPRGPQIVAVITLIALTATANAFLIVVSRTTFALARGGLFPTIFTRLTRQRRVPWLALLLGGAAQLVMVSVGSIPALTTATAFLYLLTFLASLGAVVALRQRGIIGAFAMPGYPWTAMLAFLICLGMEATAGAAGIVPGGIWLIIGAVVIFLRRHHLHTA